MTDVLHTLADIAPKALLFVAILAVGVLVARGLGRAVANLALRAGLNTLLDKAKLHFLGNGHELAGKITTYAVLLIVVQLAFSIFGPNAVSSLIHAAIVAIIATVAAILVVGVGGGLIKPAQERWENYLTSLKPAPEPEPEPEPAAKPAPRRRAKAQ